MKTIFLLAGLMLFSFITKGQDTQPNILLIISDQHSGLFISQAGYPYLETPGIDKLAEEGVTFTRSYCPYPVCVAARASFTTGVMPGKSVKNLTSYPSIGKTMLNGGYETAYYGKWHVASSKMNKVESWHGFEQYPTRPAPLRQLPINEYLCR
jgi:arylsulfatase A-like enzyme